VRVIRSRLGPLGPVAIVLPAAFAVHQLRFLLAFGGGAGAELQRTGHSYLHSFVPWLVLCVALGVGGFLRAAGRALAGQTSWGRYTLSLSALWVLCSLALVGIYVSQEFLEGLFATGHPGGLAGIFAYGGWWSIPVALAVGLVLAVVFHGARWVFDEVAQRHAAALASSRERPVASPRPRDFLLPLRPPLVGGSSGRGPPA
jgi:hypothetical protein